MSIGSNVSQWREVTKQDPCPVCEKDSWCARSSDGVKASCRRQSTSDQYGDGRHKDAKDGGDCWIFNITETGNRLRPFTPPTAAPRAAAEELHRVYSAFMAGLALSSIHRSSLLARGLTENETSRRGYRTLNRDRIAGLRAVEEAGLVDLLHQVPGFVFDADKQRWTVKGANGIAIPVRNTDGKIVAIKIRRDNPGDGPKYLYLSSKKAGGPGPGAPVHVPLFDGKTAVLGITEGELKADICSAKTERLYISIAGVSSYRASIPVIRKLAAQSVLLALDADAARNPHVAKSLARLAGELTAQRIKWSIEVWNAADGKGLDDLLVAGKQPTVLDGQAGTDYVAKLVAALPADQITRQPPPSLWTREGRTEAANALRLVERFGDDIRYCDPQKTWYVWSGARWQPDRERRIEAMAAELAAELWCEVKAAAEKKVAEKLLAELVKFAKSTNSANGIKNMLTLARSAVSIIPEKFDADRWTFNCSNGTLDLKTCQIRPHRRADFLTKLCPVAFDPDADCPLWRSVLNRIMAGNVELTGFLQRMAGYSLCGVVREHILLFCYGQGANGKSLFLGTLLDCMGGDYAMKAPPDLLMAKRNESHPTERADLAGRRLVACIEAEDGRRLAEGLVKEISGGDKVRARRMHQDFFEFHPQHTVWLAANHKPVIRGADLGIWRRVKLIPFAVTIPDHEQDKQLAEKLQAEFPGILAWMVRGCLDWQAAGMAEPNEVKAATAEYRGAMDLVGAFLDECCDRDTTLRIKASELRILYGGWCERNGEQPVSGRRFGESLQDRGIKRHTSNGVWYDGVDAKTGYA